MKIFITKNHSNVHFIYKVFIFLAKQMTKDEFDDYAKRAYEYVKGEN